MAPPQQPIIDIGHLTKDFGHGRGVFDVTIQVGKGECLGFLGPNGAGKTTCIRHLMGFVKPQSGYARICGLDCWAHAPELQRVMGYLPGEVSLPQTMSGEEFLHMMARMRHLPDMKRTAELLERFALDPSGKTKRMSLGMKRKLAIVAAFMHDPDVLILDEPTSGLDPLMQRTFVEFIKEEQSRGKTIFLSSHYFHEVEAVCDRVAMIRAGHVIDVVDLKASSVRAGDQSLEDLFIAAYESASPRAAATEAHHE